MQDNRGSTNNRIAFCIPGNTFSGTFLKCWTHLVKQLPSNIEWFLINGYAPNITYSRQSLLYRARMLRPTHYMWIDDDQVFTYEQFKTLYDHNLDIVSGIYRKSDDLFACCKLNPACMFHSKSYMGLHVSNYILHKLHILCVRAFLAYSNMRMCINDVHV